MRRILSLSSALALTVMMSSFSYGQVIEFRFEDAGTASFNTETFGSQIEDTVLAGLAANPVTITLNADTGNSPDSTSGNTGDARPVNDRLQITAIAGTGTGAGAHINGSGLSFGIDSSGTDPTGAGARESSTQFDANFNESLTLSFNQDLFFRQIDFDNLAGSDEFSIQVAGSSPILIDNDADDGSDRFDFSGGTTPSGVPGLFIPADTGVTFQATAGGVGLDNLVLEIAAVPEPSSMLALMGLAGLLAVKRRR